MGIEGGPGNARPVMGWCSEIPEKMRSSKKTLVTNDVRHYSSKCLKYRELVEFYTRIGGVTIGLGMDGGTDFSKPI
jgi:hypothetical protein